MKRLISLIIALILIVSSRHVSLGQVNDYESSWAKSEISYMMERNIISGYPDGRFRPTNNMKKCEFYKTINSLMGLTNKSEVKFDDIKPTDWYYGEVEKGLAANYLSPGISLKAKENITREEVARIIGIVFDIEDDEDASKEFIHGYPDGTFRPKAEITRAEVVKMLCNISGEIINVPKTVSKDIKTNLVVNTGDVVLKDMTIEGDLYLTEGIGEGNVTLDNVVVKGKLSIKGGGPNSIIIKNSKINTVLIDKQSGLIRVVFEDTTVEELKVLEEVKIELTNGAVIKLVELDGKIDVIVEKGSVIVTLDTVGNEIIIDSEGVIESINPTTDIIVNGQTVRANTKVRVEDEKIVWPSTPSSDKTPTSVVVIDIMITSVDNEKSITTDGGTLQMNATVIPKDATNMVVTWSVTNGTGTAIIEASTGLLTAIANGTVTVKVTSVSIPTVSKELVITISNQVHKIAQLLSDIEAAQRLYNETIEGTSYGEYAVGSRDILQYAINNAQAVVDSGTASDSEVVVAELALSDAVSAFNRGLVGQGDTIDLDAAISSAQDLYDMAVEGTGFGEYGVGSKVILLRAINDAQAVVVGPASDTQISVAKQALANEVSKFKDGLVGKGDETQLISNISLAQDLHNRAVEGTDFGDYEIGSKVILLRAIKSAETVASISASDAQILAAKQALANAVGIFKDGLVPQGDTAQLLLEISSAQDLHDRAVEGTNFGDYEIGSKDILLGAINDAQAVVVGPASDTQISVAKQALANEVSKFKDGLVPQGDTAQLLLDVSSAQDLHDRAVEGTNFGQYPIGSKVILLGAIEVAKTVSNGPASEVQILSAKQALANEVSKFKDGLVPQGDTAQLISNISSAQDLHDRAVEGTNFGNYAIGSKVILLRAINDAQVVVVGSASEVQILSAKQALADEVSKFKDGLVPQGDTAQLLSNISSAQDLHDKAVEGTNFGNYEIGSKDILLGAINDAETVASISASDAQILAAKQALANAVSKFKDGVVGKGDETQLLLEISSAQDLHDRAVEGTNFGDYEIGSKDILLGAIEVAKTVSNGPASEVQILSAKQALANEVSKFKDGLVPQGDTAQLISNISSAQDLHNRAVEGTDFGDYEIGSKVILLGAINDAQAVASISASEVQILSAKQALADAVSKFKDGVVGKGDETQLLSNISSAQDLHNRAVEGTNFGNYAIGSKDILLRAIKSAETVASISASDAQILAAKQALANAVGIFKDGLVPQGDTAQLLLEISSAQDLHDKAVEGTNFGQYPIGSKVILLGAIEVAKTVSNGPASDAQILAAKQALANAVGIFKDGLVPQGDTAQLLLEISSAQDLHDRATEGTNFGQYPIGSKVILLRAIEVAKTVSNGPASEVQILSAKQALANEVSKFKDGLVPQGDTAQLLLEISSAQDLHNRAVEGTNFGNNAIGSKNTLQAAINDAQTVTTEPSSDAQISVAKQALADAANIFKLKVVPQGDIAQLLLEISSAQDLHNRAVEGTNFGNYAIGSKDILLRAIKSAETVASISASDAQILAAKQALANAVGIFKDGLVPQGDTAQLLLEISSAQDLHDRAVEGTNFGNYEIGSKVILLGAIEVAKTVSNGPASEVQILSAKQALANEVSKFKDELVPQGDTAQLISNISSAQDLHDRAVEGTNFGNYEIGSKVILLRAINDAQAVVVGPASDTQISVAKQALADAANIFKLKVVPQGDTAQLLSNISSAQNLHNRAVEGTDFGNYEIGSKVILLGAINDAQAVVVGPASDTQISVAKQALADAVGIFEGGLVRQGNTTDLDAAISSAQDLYDMAVEGTNFGDYEIGSKAILLGAIKSAETVANGLASDTQMLAAESALANAVGIFAVGLVAQGNTIDLDVAISSANNLYDRAVEGTNFGQYPIGSKNTLQAAINDAQTVATEPSSDAQILAAKQALANAVGIFKDGLVPQGDTAQLLSNISSAQDLHDKAVEGTNFGNYEIGSKVILLGAINDAQAVASISASEVQILSAKQALADAVSKFKDGVVGKGDETQLISNISSAQDLHNRAVEGTNFGQYPIGSKNTLQAAINDAQTVATEPSSDAQILAAKQALANAVGIFKDGLVPQGDTAQLLSNISSAQDLHNRAVEGTNFGNYAIGSKDILLGAINDAETVASISASDTQISVAKQALANEVSKFKDGLVPQGDTAQLLLEISSAQDLHNRAVEGTNFGNNAIGSKNTLQAAINDAQTVTTEPASDTQISVAKQALADAANIFKLKVVPQGDTAQLLLEISSAQDLHDRAVEGTNFGQSAVGTKATLQSAINDAKAVATEPSSTTQILAARGILANAVSTFEAGKETQYTLTLIGDNITSDPAAGKMDRDRLVKVRVEPAVGRRVSTFTVGEEDKKAELVAGIPNEYIFTITGDTTVVVTYEALIFEVIFKDHNNTVIKIEEVKYGESASLPENPTRVGYTFTGWEGSYINITKTETVAAIYTANTPYKVEHCQQLKTGTSYTITDTDNLNGTIGELTAAEAKEYTGFTVRKFNQKIIDSIRATEVFILYDRHVFTVTFIDYNGSELKIQEVRYEGNASPPTNPTREGYTFIGWEGSYTNIQESKTIVATYTENQLKEKD